MPKFGRPSSRSKMPYFSDRWSEVSRNAPFGTYYTPPLYTKIVGSKYRKIDQDSSRSLSPIARGESESSLASLNPRPVIPPIYKTPRIEPESPAKELEKMVNSLLPPLSRDQELPPRSIYLADEEHATLLHIAQEALRPIPDLMSRLKRAYLRLAKMDINLTGCAAFRDVVEACNAADIPLQYELHRIICAMFVMPTRDTVSFVNYEKVISFLGAVSKSLNDNTHRRSLDNMVSEQHYDHARHDNKPHYYYDDDFHGNAETDSGRKTSPRGPTLKQWQILDTISTELGPHRRIPLLQVRLACQRADPAHRGTLSQKQLVEILEEHGVSLSSRTLTAIMDHCRYMGGGQFYWEDLLNLLERLQPVSTGLQIPTSRMPGEYARQIPQPTASWPHHELPPNTQLHTPAPGGGMTSPSPKFEDFSQQVQEADKHEPLRRKIEYNNSQHQISLANDKREPIKSPYSNSNDYENMKEPWFNRFLKFVDAIYMKDVNNRGYLPTGEVYQLAMDLSHKFHLKLTATEIISALEGSQIDNDRMQTDLNSFLKRLSIVNQHD